MNKKFILEFDEIPALIFISHDGNSEQVYKDGKEIRTWRSIKINSHIEEPTIHEIEYATVRESDLL